MIRRPLNARFVDKVLAGIKTTTIRDKAWPTFTPIMLFRWEDKPYRSKQVEIAPVMVMYTCGFDIWRVGDRMEYSAVCLLDRTLDETEGFESPEDMDEWFRQIVKPGEVVSKSLMVFRLMGGGLA